MVYVSINSEKPAMINICSLSSSRSRTERSTDRQSDDGRAAPVPVVSSPLRQSTTANQSRRRSRSPARERDAQQQSRHNKTGDK